MITEKYWAETNDRIEYFFGRLHSVFGELEKHSKKGFEPNTFHAITPTLRNRFRMWRGNFFYSNGQWRESRFVHEQEVRWS